MAEDWHKASVNEGEIMRERAVKVVDDLHGLIVAHRTKLLKEGHPRGAERWSYALDALADAADAIRELPCQRKTEGADA